MSVQANQISIEKLLQNPKNYNGLVLTVVGYYIDEFENRSLWSSKNDKNKSNYNRSLWLVYSKDMKALDKNNKPTDLSFLFKKLVSVTGTFRFKPDTINGKIYGHGHMNIWPAELTEITIIKATHWDKNGAVGT